MSSNIAPFEVKLFPLPDIVLFPYALVPLHIFEPRYRDMIQDAIDGDRKIALAIPLESETDIPPSLFPVACIGEIQHFQQTEDGRYYIILRGLNRIRLIEEMETTNLYRVAKAVYLEDHGPFMDTMKRDLLRNELFRYLQNNLPSDPEIPQILEYLSNKCRDPMLTDILSYVLPLDSQTKRSLLSNIDVDERMEHLAKAARVVQLPDQYRNDNVIGNLPGFSNN